MPEQSLFFYDNQTNIKLQLRQLKFVFYGADAAADNLLKSSSCRVDVSTLFHFISSGKFLCLLSCTLYSIKHKKVENWRLNPLQAYKIRDEIECIKNVLIRLCMSIFLDKLRIIVNLTMKMWFLCLFMFFVRWNVNRFQIISIYPTRCERQSSARRFVCDEQD